MTSIQALEIVGTGGLGVLVVALILSKFLNLGLEVALIIYVFAGAVALILGANGSY
jgi:hypothetical protein